MKFVWKYRQIPTLWKFLLFSKIPNLPVPLGNVNKMRRGRNSGEIEKRKGPHPKPPITLAWLYRYGASMALIWRFDHFLQRRGGIHTGVWIWAGAYRGAGLSFYAKEGWDTQEGMDMSWTKSNNPNWEGGEKPEIWSTLWHNKFVNTYWRACVYSPACTGMYVFATYLCIYMCMCVHTCMCTYIPTYVSAYVRAHVHT